jgi:hypothetical protein
MRQNKYLFYVLLLIVSAVSSACFQNPADQIVLHIENANGKSFELKKKDLAELRHISIDATSKDGTTSRFEGVKLVDVLRSADAPLGDSLRGKNMTSSVIVEGADGYKASFTLAELDPDFSDKTVILADKRDGQALPKKKGNYGWSFRMKQNARRVGCDKLLN